MQFLKYLLLSTPVLMGLFSTSVAHADISVLIFDNQGPADRIINTGHSAYALWDICAETPTKLRLCTDADVEKGVVLNKLPKMSAEKYNWIATPINEFFYGAASRDAAPIIATKNISKAEDKKRYDDYYSQSIADSDDKGRWTNSVGALYVRTVYEYRLPGFYDDEVSIMNGLNGAVNKSNYDIFLHNCADFTSAALKPIFNENLAHSSNDVGLHSPKAIAKNLTKLAMENPDLHMFVIKRPQISGDYPRSRSIMASSENLYKNPLFAGFLFLLVPEIPLAALALDEVISPFRQDPAYKKSLTPEERLSILGTPEEWKYYKSEFHDLVAKAKDDGSLPSELREIISSAKNDKDVPKKLTNYFAHHGEYVINGDDIELKLPIQGETEPRTVGMTRETISNGDKQIGYLVLLADLGQTIYERARTRSSMEDFKNDWSLMQTLLAAGSRGPASVDLSSPSSLGISDELYDRLFPYYTMQCAASQMHQIGGNNGGKYGHGLMYIHGACKDSSTDHPKLKMCDDKSPGGAVVSLDSIYSNTLFATLDGKDLLFDAGLKKDQTLDKDFFDQTVQKILKSGAVHGIKMNPTFVHKQETMSDEEYVARESTKTDWAVSFARDAACVRVPMNKAQVSAMVDSLNKRNEDYISGKIPFAWNEFTNNCVTLMRNALASAGIHKPEITKKPGLLGKVKETIEAELPIPGMDMVNTVETVNNISKIDTAEKVFSSKELRTNFENFETLPLGGSVEWIPMHVSNNTLFQQGDFNFDPVGGKTKGKFMDYLNDARYSTVEGNLNRVLARLQEVQRDRITISNETSDLGKFSVKYNKWIDDSITDIQSKLNKIKAQKASESAQADSK